MVIKPLCSGLNETVYVKVLKSGRRKEGKKANKKEGKKDGKGVGGTQTYCRGVPEMYVLFCKPIPEGKGAHVKCFAVVLIL